MDRETALLPAPKGRGVGFTVLTAVLAVAFTLFVAIPILALLLYVPPSTLVASFSDPVVTDAIRLSLTTSTAATLIVIAFGMPLAFLNTRTRYPGRDLVETLTDLPIVLPPAVAGLGLLLAFGRFGLVGQFLAPFGITIAFTTLAVVMAQTFVAAPFFLRQARTAFGEVDPAYEAAARSLGASPAYVFRRITVPLAAEGLVSGAIMTLARALGEFGATIMFAGNIQGRTQTMPLAIYTALQSDITASVALAVILLAISFGVIASVRALGRRASRKL
ncbi:MAG: molybdate ABC transporter permease subunit [Methanospirillum sp.]|nr:molybdate ABC transporter permease subunit [Methanospirillum sp.]